MRLAALAKWVLGPVLAAGLAAGLGRWRAGEGKGSFAARAAVLPEGERATAARSPALAIANATWALGTAEAVKQMARFELDRLDASEGERRARVFVRFGIIDTNPDGQAALFNQACVADARDCDHLKEAAERESRARLVPPGNQLPPYFLAGHPHLDVPPGP